MKERDQPAICSTCKCVGPPRKEATAQGWERAQGSQSKKSDWRCPEHHEVKEPLRVSPRVLGLLFASGWEMFATRNRRRKR